LEVVISVLYQASAFDNVFSACVKHFHVVQLEFDQNDGDRPMNNSDELVRWRLHEANVQRAVRAAALRKR
jgi:hypothetical protein